MLYRAKHYLKYIDTRVPTHAHTHADVVLNGAAFDLLKCQLKSFFISWNHLLFERLDLKHVGFHFSVFLTLCVSQSGVVYSHWRTHEKKTSKLNFINLRYPESMVVFKKSCLNTVLFLCPLIHNSFVPDWTLENLY